MLFMKWPFALLLLLSLADVIFSDREESDEYDDSEGGKKVVTDAPPTTTTTEPPPKDPEASVCMIDGGDLSARRTYQQNPDLLVVYYEPSGEEGVTNDQLVYRNFNATVRVPITIEQASVGRYKHRLFPRNLVNFVVMNAHEDGIAHYVTYMDRSTSAFPSEYVPRTREYKQSHFDLRNLNYEPSFAAGRRNWDSDTDNVTFAGFYDAWKCHDVFGFQEKLCRNGTLCRRSDEVTLCTYDVALDKTVAIHRDTEHEAAYGTAQCNFFVKVANSTEEEDGVAFVKIAVFHEGEDTICYRHPANWTDVYAMRFTGSKAKDHECKFLRGEGRTKKRTTTTTKRTTSPSNSTDRRPTASATTKKYTRRPRPGGQSSAANGRLFGFQQPLMIAAPWLTALAAFIVL